MSELSDYITTLTTLVGYWPLDDTSGTAAVEGGGTSGNGTYVGTPTLAQAGPPFPDSKSVLLNGTTQYISIETGVIDDALEGSDDIVLCGWFRQDTSNWNNVESQSENLFHLFGYYGTGGYTASMISFGLTNAGILKADVRSKMTAPLELSARQITATSEPVTINTLHRGIWTCALLYIDYSGDKMYLYRNGKLVAETGVGGVGAVTFDNNVYTGDGNPTWADGLGGYYNGSDYVNCFSGNIAQCFILKGASNVATIASTVWEKGSRTFMQTPPKAPKKGFYSPHHLNL